MNDSNFVIKYIDGRKIGFLSTKNAKFYLGEDGILSTQIRGSFGSEFGGKFEDGALEHIPSEHIKYVSKHIEQLTYMYSVLIGRAKQQ